jgi:hypothetical protein
MAKKAEPKAKTCFIITPIGADNSDVRRHADGVIKSVINPILCEEFDFEDVKAAHEISTSGSINNQLMGRILDDDLVIANLTGTNPNVMYEVAVRHATAKPIIHICEEGTKLPFDIIDQRTIFYTDDMLGVEELKNNLKAMVADAINVKEFKDNPIYNATKNKMIIESIANDPDKGFEKLLLDKITNLEERISVSTFSRPLFNKNFQKLKLRFPLSIKNIEEVQEDVLSALSKEFVSVYLMGNAQIEDSVYVIEYQIRSKQKFDVRDILHALRVNNIDTESLDGVSVSPRSQLIKYPEFFD